MKIETKVKLYKFKLNFKTFIFALSGTIIGYLAGMGLLSLLGIG